jgi:predicted ATPase
MFVARRSAANWPYRTAPNRLALSAVPEDADRFSAVIFLRDLLRDRIQSLQLNSVAMRAPCPPDAPRAFQPDGSNLPILVRRLRKDAPTRFRWWLDHLRTVLGDLTDLDAPEQPHDRHLYLEATFRDGLKVPSWLLSDGTLRLMALTLLAYLPPEGDVYVVEEPENGVHPKAVEAVVQSLSSVYEGQVFMATHSPLIVGLVEPEKLLLFSRTEDGGTTIVPGTEHPRLKEWLRGAPLSELFAAGVLG